jgi:hypothetical protein
MATKEYMSKEATKLIATVAEYLMSAQLLTLHHSSIASEFFVSGTD